MTGLIHGTDEQGSFPGVSNDAELIHNDEDDELSFLTCEALTREI